ncbi:MAG TPA: histidine kinase [Saprospiraceae bacterium]|nr:histidine kinase [Saprospiraceae bacterium]
MLIIILSAGLLFLGLYFFYKKTSNSGTLPFSKLNLVFATFMTISFYVSAATAIKFLITRFKTQNYLNQLKKEKAETELKFLKAQINPHFLFNSLNSIYGTIDKQNSLARNTLLKFSEMLRYQLYECNSEKVNLEKEIEYLKNFIALQTMRSEDSLKVKFQIDEHISGNIAPLLFIPFVENAFKYHSNFDDKPNSIHIQLYKKKDLLYFIVTNTIDCTTRVDLTENTGIGIQNVKRRLELLYPGSYTLDILKGQQEYKISLSLNMQ